MKRYIFLLSAIFLLLADQLKAQQLKVINDNCQFYVISPNANCFAGAPDGGPSNFYRFSDDYFYQSNAQFASIITDLGEVPTSFNTDAAIWTLGTTDYRTFPAFDGGNVKGRMIGFSKDFTSLLVSNRGYFVYEKQENGTYLGTQIFLPTKDSIYHLAPQYVQVKGFSSDGRRIAGRFLNSDGQRETPFIIERNDAGEWHCRFVGIRQLICDGCVMPERPIREGDDDTNYALRLRDYYEARNAIETGVYYELSNMSMSENGKYLAVNVPMMIDGVEVYQMTYAGVIDIDADTLYIFHSVPDAACPAVSNYGEASICTPALGYLRQTYIGSIRDVSNPQLLVNWVKQKTSGRLDLSDQMTFMTNSFGSEGVMAGSALISAEGNGFVSFLYDEWNTNDLYNFLVRLDTPTGQSSILTDKPLIYPNPTKNNLYFNQELRNIKLYTPTGQLVYQQFDPSVALDISYLASGVYLLIAQQNNQYITHKIIVE